MRLIEDIITELEADLARIDLITDEYDPTYGSLSGCQNALDLYRLFAKLSRACADRDALKAGITVCAEDPWS